MTRDEAIRQIENRWSIMDYGESEALGEALDMAIEALSEPSKLKNPCDSLLKDDSEADKEHERKLEPSGDKGGDAEVTAIPEGTGLMQQSPNDGADLISREDAIEVVNRIKSTNNWQGAVIALLSALPTADRPTGEWHDSFGFSHCSLCGFGVPRPIGKETSYNYCPYCGARLYKAGENHETD